jgi:AraC family transcriptional regulator
LSAKNEISTALAARLGRPCSAVGRRAHLARGYLPPARLRDVLAYIEHHLHEDLRSAAVGRPADIGVSQLKLQVRRSVGMPIHRYVIRRRVDHATWLLRQSQLPISQIAAEGFVRAARLAGMSPAIAVTVVKHPAASATANGSKGAIP